MKPANQAVPYTYRSSISPKADSLPHLADARVHVSHPETFNAQVHRASPERPGAQTRRPKPKCCRGRPCSAPRSVSSVAVGSAAPCSIVTFRFRTLTRPGVTALRNIRFQARSVHVGNRSRGTDAGNGRNEDRNDRISSWSEASEDFETERCRLHKAMTRCGGGSVSSIVKARWQFDDDTHMGERTGDWITSPALWSTSTVPTAADSADITRVARPRSALARRWRRMRSPLTPDFTSCPRRPWISHPGAP